MLTILQAAFLGIVQGITEFLPISSSGHLVVIQQLFGWKGDNAMILAFDVALHIGTLVAVLVAFRKEVIEMLTGKAWRLVGLLIVATIPAVVIGFLFKHNIEALFSSVKTVGVSWLIIGTVLWFTRYANPPSPPLEKGGEGGFLDVSTLKSFLIGCAQAIAIIPGISRSGSTMATGIFAKLNRTTAARFAFLMAIPAIGGSAVLDAKELINFPKEGLPQMLIGVVAAFIAGYFSIHLLLRIIRNGKLWYFGVYCWLAGVATLIAISRHLL